MLNKSFCKKCRTRAYEQACEYEWPKNVALIFKWTEESDEEWNNKTVYCLWRHADNIKRGETTERHEAFVSTKQNAPNECPFVLEHFMEAQNNA